jgi:hypothetical protein
LSSIGRTQGQQLTQHKEGGVLRFVDHQQVVPAIGTGLAQRRKQQVLQQLDAVLA